jgi:hypothetical protein
MFVIQPIIPGFRTIMEQILAAPKILVTVCNLLEGTVYEEERYDLLQAGQEMRHENALSWLSSGSDTASPEPVWPKGGALQLPPPTPCSLLPRGATRE